MLIRSRSRVRSRARVRLRTNKYLSIAMEKKIEKRLVRLRKSLIEANLDAILVLTEENRRYLSGFTGEDTTFDESAGALFITDSKLVLATDSRFELQAENEAQGYEIYCYKKGLVEELPNILKMFRAKRIGFESSRMSYMQYKKISEKIDSKNLKVEFMETENIVENLRMIKEPAEIDAIKKALSIAESVFKDFSKSVICGTREKEAAWAMEKGMREAGADTLSFPTIVASGPNSALPHAIPGDRIFKEGEPILFDWGAKLNGYCSDISRTLVIGKADDQFKNVYKTVLEAQMKAISAIRPGISSKAVDNIARSRINESEFKDKFGHGLGHGAGLSVHEYPRLSPLKEITLEAGMVFTVEPGIYIPDWGGVRIENMVVVREDGAEVLNDLDTSLSVIGER